jgi:diguanylate cyclase
MEFNFFPTVSSISAPIVIQATLGMSVCDASKLMEEYDVTVLLIEANNERYIISVEDILQYVRDGGNILNPIAQAPFRTLICIPEYIPIVSVIETIEKQQVKYIGVTDTQNNVVKILSDLDILYAIDPHVLFEKKSVADLLVTTNATTFTADWILDDVLCHLRNLQDAIVIVENNVPTGIITGKDLCRIIASGQATDQPLNFYMTTPVVTTELSASIHEAIMHLKNSNVNRVVIVDHNRQFVKVVSRSELVGFAYGVWMTLLKKQAGDMREMVNLLEAKATDFDKSTILDPMTGLGNRNLLQNKVSEEIKRIRRYHSAPFSLALIQIDFFKKNLEIWGHQLCDEILKAVTTTLSESIRTTDNLIRWDGDAFAILLPNTTVSGAGEFAYRVRSTITESPVVEDIKLTISMGMAQFSPDEKDTEFFERTGQALFRAKDQGRNQVVLDFG